MHIPSRITDRDRDLLHLLYNHRVLTTDHIKDLFFQNEITTRHRLTTLYKLQLVDRFQPLVAKGSAPFHYVLGHAGYLVVAADRNPYSDKLPRWSQEKALAIGRSQHLRHKLGINTFFCELARQARANPNCELLDWTSERAFRHPRRFTVCPDARGAWREGSRSTGFYLEFDRGTETLERLARKIGDYRNFIRNNGGADFVLLFYFLTNRREANARRILANTESPIPIATASRQRGGMPHESIWAILGGAEPKHRLSLIPKASALVYKQ
jgi:hypothetical protein